MRAESKHGKRLNPRKTDLHRWRETFAEKLRERGVEAEATRQATRGRIRNFEPLWRVKANSHGRLRTSRPTMKCSANTMATRAAAADAWQEIARALAASGDKSDRDLAQSVSTYVGEMLEAGASRTKESQIPSERIRLVEREARGSIHER